MNNESNFVELKNSNRIWAVGSIHSNLQAFNSIKNYIIKNFTKGDKLVFLGNILGLGPNSKETLSSLIDLRFYLMSKFTLKPDEIVFLRGAQEEMFTKVLQLQIAPNPSEIITWIFEHGVDKTLNSYGFTNKEYLLNLKHAAFSSTKKILFVNRGVDITRPLSAQSDCFWWGYQNFSKIHVPYNTFNRIVRGYQSNQSNDLEFSKNRVVCTLFKQPLSNNRVFAGIFDNNGDILDLFESN